MTDKPVGPLARSREALLQTRGLNLGSGPHYAEGWVNVDKYEPPEGCKPPDVYLDVCLLPTVFPESSLRAVYMGHFLEHLPWDDIPYVLRKVTTVCVPGATVMAVGPCILKAIQTSQPTHILQAILADPRQAPDGTGHAWTPTTELTKEAMESGGLLDVTVVPIVGVTKPTWPNPSTAPWQVAVMGTAP